MKLNFIFIAMDLLTLLVYPVLFVYGKLRQFVKAEKGIMPVNSLSAVFVALDE